MKLGIKVNALYRDGSKLSQPLSSALVENEDEEEMEDLMKAPIAAKAPVVAERIVERVIERAVERQRLPHRRKGYTRKPMSVAIRSIFGLANTRKESSVRSSLTCTRKALRSAR